MSIWIKSFLKGPAADFVEYFPNGSLFCLVKSTFLHSFMRHFFRIYHYANCHADILILRRGMTDRSCRDVESSRFLALPKVFNEAPHINGIISPHSFTSFARQSDHLISQSVSLNDGQNIGLKSSQSETPSPMVYCSHHAYVSLMDKTIGEEVSDCDKFSQQVLTIIDTNGLTNQLIHPSVEQMNVMIWLHWYEGPHATLLEVLEINCFQQRSNCDILCLRVNQNICMTICVNGRFWKSVECKIRPTFFGKYFSKS